MAPPGYRRVEPAIVHLAEPVPYPHPNTYGLFITTAALCGHYSITRSDYFYDLPSWVAPTCLKCVRVLAEECA